MEGRGEEEVVEGMREKKMEGGKAEKSEWSERMTEKGRECSSFQAFLRGKSLRHFLLKEFSVEQCIMCSCEWASKSLKSPLHFSGGTCMHSY